MCIYSCPRTSIEKIIHSSLNCLVKKSVGRVPTVVGGKQIWLASMRTQVRSLTSLSALRIWCCCELWGRSQMRLRSELLWLCCSLAATTLIQPLAWEPPYATSTALKRQKRKKKSINDTRKVLFSTLNSIPSFEMTIYVEVPYGLNYYSFAVLWNQDMCILQDCWSFWVLFGLIWVLCISI